MATTEVGKEKATAAVSATAAAEVRAAGGTMPAVGLAAKLQVALERRRRHCIGTNG